MLRLPPVAFIFLFCCLLAASSPTLGQKNVADSVKRDEVAFVVIHDPNAILDQIESSVFFQNRKFLKAVELLTDERFSLTTEDRLLELEDKWYEIRQTLEKVEKISIVIHSWKQTWGMSLGDLFSHTPEFTMVFESSPETNRALEENFLSVKSMFPQSEEEDDTDDFVSETGLNGLKGITVEQIDNYIMLSNSPENSEQLSQQLKKQRVPENFRSLSKNRSYMQVQKLLKVKERSPTVHGFLTSNNFSGFAKSMIDPSLSFYSSNSLAAIGFQAFLDERSDSIETPDGTFRAAINWDFVLTYTQPASGFGKLVDSFEPLGDLPRLPFSATSVSAAGVDMNKKLSGFTDLFDNDQSGLFYPKEFTEEELEELSKTLDPSELEKLADIDPMSAEEVFGQHQFQLFRTPKEFDFEKLLSSSSAKIVISYDDPNQNPNSYYASSVKHVVIEKISDPVEMMRVLQQKVEQENLGQPDSIRLVEVDNDYGRLFARRESAIREMYAQRISQWNQSTEDMRAQVESGEIEMSLEELDEMEESNRKMLDRIYPKIPESGPLDNEVMSQQKEYFINDEWMISTDHVSMKRILNAIYEEVPTPQTFDLLLHASSKSSGQNSPIKVVYKSNKSHESFGSGMFGVVSFEMERIWKKYDQNEAMEVMMSRPDEFGLRNQIESTDDAAAAFKHLIALAFNDTFGTSMSLYSKDDHKMRVFGQIFSLVE